MNRVDICLANQNASVCGVTGDVQSGEFGLAILWLDLSELTSWHPEVHKERTYAAFLQLGLKSKVQEDNYVSGYVKQQIGGIINWAQSSCKCEHFLL